MGQEKKLRQALKINKKLLKQFKGNLNNTDSCSLFIFRIIYSFLNFANLNYDKSKFKVLNKKLVLNIFYNSQLIKDKSEGLTLTMAPIFTGDKEHFYDFYKFVIEDFMEANLNYEKKLFYFHFLIDGAAYNCFKNLLPAKIKTSTFLDIWEILIAKYGIENKLVFFFFEQLLNLGKIQKHNEPEKVCAYKEIIFLIESFLKIENVDESRYYKSFAFAVLTTLDVDTRANYKKTLIAQCDYINLDKIKNFLKTTLEVSNSSEAALITS